MTRYLKKSTAVDVGLGPFLDETDGKTAETALTISQTDVRLKKNNASWVAKNQSSSATHEENGWYEISLDATDTNTEGELIVAVHEAGALPVWDVFTVVHDNIYDSWFVGDFLQVDLTQIAGSTVNTTVAQLGVNAVQIGTTVQSTGDVNARVLDVQGRLPAALVSGRIDASVGAMAANVVTATSIAADAITDAKVASDVTIASVTGAVGSVTAGVTLTSGERTSIAEALLKLDLSTVTGEAARSVLNAVRFLRNKWSISGTTLTVTKEDDTTSAWTSALTTSAVAEPITASDPT